MKSLPQQMLPEGGVTQSHCFTEDHIARTKCPSLPFSEHMVSKVEYAKQNNGEQESNIRLDTYFHAVSTK